MKICLIGLAVSCPHLLLSVRWPRRAASGRCDHRHWGLAGPTKSSCSIEKRVYSCNNDRNRAAEHAMSRWSGMVALACLLAGTSTAIAQTSNDHPRTFGVPQGSSSSNNATRTAVAIRSGLFRRRFASRFTGPVRQCRLPRIQVQSERAICRIHMVSKDASGEGPTRVPQCHVLPPPLAGRDCFLRQPLPRTSFLRVPMKLMQPFASIRARLERRRI